MKFRNHNRSKILRYLIRGWKLRTMDYSFWKIEIEYLFPSFSKKNDGETYKIFEWSIGIFRKFKYYKCRKYCPFFKKRRKKLESSNKTRKFRKNLRKKYNKDGRPYSYSSNDNVFLISGKGN